MLENIPSPIRSLWNSEIELRKGIWAYIFRHGEPNPHFSEARRHLEEALHGARQGEFETWGSRDHVAKTVEQDQIDEQRVTPSTKEPPRF